MKFSCVRKNWLLFGLLTASPLLITPSSLENHAQGLGERKLADTGAGPVVVDLRPVLNLRKLREGDNTIYTLGDHFTLVARVKGGQLAGFSATGRNGQTLPLILTKDPFKASIRKQIAKLLKENTPEERRKRKQEQLHAAIQKMIKELDGGEEKGCWLIGLILTPDDPDGQYVVAYGACPKGGY